MIAQSQVSGALIQSLAAGLQASDPLIILSLSSTLLSFSYLPDGCKSLLDHHILTCLPHLLRLGYKHDVTGIAVEILWNLFEHAASRSEIRISEPHPTLSTLASNEEMGSEAVLTEPMASALSSLFTTVLLDGFRDSDKELRNNVLVVINLVLGCSQVFAVTCHLSGLFGATMAVSCAPECCNGAPYVKPWALSTDELDLELKLLCWTTATKSCVVLPEVLGLAESMGLMNLMMQHLDVTNPPPAVRRWSPDRASALRSAAISVLHQVSPISVSQFLCADGVNVVLSLIARCPVSCHVEAALNQLLALCTAVPEMAEELGSRSAFPTILSLIQVDSGWPDSLRQTALQLLSVMCSSSENKKRFRKAHGISVLVEQLGQISQLDATLPAPMALAVLNSVWCCIIPDRKNVARFLVSDGIDLLLNHLETGNRAHRSLVLSLLADLLENERVLPFFHEWRSNLNQVPAASLLIRFWKVCFCIALFFFRRDSRVEHFLAGGGFKAWHNNRWCSDKYCSAIDGIKQVHGLGCPRVCCLWQHCTGQEGTTSCHHGELFGRRSPVKDLHGEAMLAGSLASSDKLYRHVDIIVIACAMQPLTDDC